MILHESTKVMVCSHDGDTDFFDIIAGFLQGDKPAPHLFIIDQDCQWQMSTDLMKENEIT